MAPRRNPGQKVDDLTAQVTRLYADAEQVILQRIASSLGRGIASPQWMEHKLLELQLIQARLRGEMAGLATKSASEITSVLTTAYNLGQGDAIVDLHNAGLGYAFKQGAVSGVNQLNALLQETTASVLAQHQRILRSVDDIYRQAISAATPLQLAGVITRKDAVQRALNTFADAGISGFTDRAGRKWNLTSYTDMATRTAARRAQVEGHANQLAAHDQNLVYVSDHAGECELCRPFEGKVLALVGDGTRTTLDEAKARGVFHPGCRHTIGLYLPGVSNLKHEPDPEGYAARQQQRGIERNIRKWKNRESVALDPATKAQARAKVRAHQAQMRDHLEKNPYLKRQPDRESLGWAQSKAKVGKSYPTPDRTLTPLAEPKPKTWREMPQAELNASFEQKFTSAVKKATGQTPTVILEEVKGAISVAIKGDGFQLYRELSADRKTIEHQYFRVSQKFQGQGWATKINAEMFEEYRKNGVQYVVTDANIDVGGYTWARQGFDWDRTYYDYDLGDYAIWDTSLDRIEEALFSLTEAEMDGMTGSGTPLPDQIEKMRSRISEGDIPTPFELSQLGSSHTWIDENGRTMWIGKKGMLGSSWRGRFTL